MWLFRLNLSVSWVESYLHSQGWEMILTIIIISKMIFSLCFNNNHLAERWQRACGKGEGKESHLKSHFSNPPCVGKIIRQLHPQSDVISAWRQWRPSWHTHNFTLLLYADALSVILLYLWEQTCEFLFKLTRHSWVQGLKGCYYQIYFRIWIWVQGSHLN